MIITLKGANFSSNKIGQLDSWTVFTSLGTGATYSGPRVLGKGENFNATVTLAEGYEVGSAGIKLVMGTTEYPAGVSKKDNTITFNLTSVTGHITITVPTINTNTGEETLGEVEVQGEFFVGNATDKDWYVYKPDGFDQAYLRISNSGKAHNVIYELTPGRTYRFEFNNGNASTTARCRLAIFDRDVNNIIKAPLSTDGSGNYDSYTPSIQIVHYENILTLTKEFTAPENSKYLICTIGWGSSLGKPLPNLTYKLTKLPE